MTNYTGPRVVEGFLKKKKGNKSMRLFSDYIKRWFVLDLTKGTFHYAGAKGKKPNKILHLREIFKCKVPEKNSSNCDWPFYF